MVTNMSLFPGAQRCTKAADDADVFTSKLDPPGGGVGEGPEPSKELEGSSGMVYLGKVSASIRYPVHLFRQRPNGQTWPDHVA